MKHLHPASINFLINAAVFAGFGVALLVDPAGLKAMGVELPTPTSKSEIRGFYGGTQLGLAAMFAAAAVRVAWSAPILFAQAVILYGMAVGRILGLLVDGYGHPMMVVFALLELFGGTVAVLMLRGMRQPPTAQRLPPEV